MESKGRVGGGERQIIRRPDGHLVIDGTWQACSHEVRERLTASETSSSAKERNRRERKFFSMEVRAEVLRRRIADYWHRLARGADSLLARKYLKQIYADREELCKLIEHDRQKPEIIRSNSTPDTR